MSVETYNKIYEYKGFTLTEVRYKQGPHAIVWGWHVDCAPLHLARGKPSFDALRPYCSKCFLVMPEDVFQHMENARQFIQTGLIAPSGLVYPN